MVQSSKVSSPGKVLTLCLRAPSTTPPSGKAKPSAPTSTPFLPRSLPRRPLRCRANSRPHLPPSRALSMTTSAMSTMSSMPTKRRRERRGSQSSARICWIFGAGSQRSNMRGNRMCCRAREESFLGGEGMRRTVKGEAEEVAVGTETRTRMRR